MKKLSLCVPTYNRKYFLERLINHIITESRGIEQRIELCISDNGSIDGTEDMVRKYVQKHPFIKYRKNKKNLGFDKNLMAVADMAKGEYCWFMGDDDLYVKGAIKKMLSLLDKSRYDYIIAEYDTPHKKKMGSWIASSEVLEGESVKPFFIDNVCALSFMGSNVFRRSIYQKIRKELPENYYGFMHVGIQFHSLSRIKSMFIIRDTRILASQEGTLPNRRTALLIYLNLSKSCKYAYDHRFISKRDYISALNRVYANFYLYLIYDYAILKENGATPKELQVILDEVKSFVRNTGNNRLLMNIVYISIRITPLMRIMRWLYIGVYIRFMNNFRKNKLTNPYDTFKNSEKRGARETNF